MSTLEQSLRALEERLESRYQGLVLKTTLLSGGDEYEPPIVRIMAVQIPADSRKQGLGSKVMSQIISWADGHGAMLSLSPSTDFGASSVSRLTKFYRRFGFKPNKGRNKDFRTRDTMLRNPSLRKSSATYKTLRKWDKEHCESKPCDGGNGSAIRKANEGPKLRSYFENSKTDPVSRYFLEQYGDDSRIRALLPKDIEADAQEAIENHVAKLELDQINPYSISKIAWAGRMDKPASMKAWRAETPILNFNSPNFSPFSSTMGSLPTNGDIVSVGGSFSVDIDNSRPHISGVVNFLFPLHYWVAVKRSWNTINFREHTDFFYKQVPVRIDLRNSPEFNKVYRKWLLGGLNSTKTASKVAQRYLEARLSKREAGLIRPPEDLVNHMTTIAEGAVAKWALRKQKGDVGFINSYALEDYRNKEAEVFKGSGARGKYKEQADSLWLINHDSLSRKIIFRVNFFDNPSSKGTYYWDGFDHTVVLFVDSSKKGNWNLRDLDSVRGTIQHELVHVMQKEYAIKADLRDSDGGVGVGGLPFAKRDRKFTQTMRDKEKELKQIAREEGVNEGWIEIHALDDIEFYSRLLDEIAEFKSFVEEYSWHKKAVDNEDIKSHIKHSKFFISLKRHKRESWKKAVGLFVEAVQNT